MRFRNYGIVPVQKVAFAPAGGNPAMFVRLPGNFSPDIGVPQPQPAAVTDVVLTGYDANGNPTNAEGQIIPAGQAVNASNGQVITPSPSVSPGPGWGASPPAGFDMTVVGYTQDGQGFPLNAAGQIVPGAPGEYDASTKAPAVADTTVVGYTSNGLPLNAEGQVVPGAPSQTGKAVADAIKAGQYVPGVSDNPAIVSAVLATTNPNVGPSPALNNLMSGAPQPSFFSQIPTWGWLAGGAAVLGLGWLALRRPKGSVA